MAGVAPVSTPASSELVREIPLNRQNRNSSMPKIACNRISIAVRSVIARKAADNRRAQTGSSASVAKSRLTAAMVNTPMEPET
ncbi:hypothetical protein SDC9_159525 [bioreactor metagenome]|uniref:Uncharacterized protein n=1 Tax=bioreactor metagenome TaxID=1076179 RepID=A0A645FIZ1_9ZZZZ